MYFLALSNAPPEFPKKMARQTAINVAPASVPPMKFTPKISPAMAGTINAISDGETMRLSACLVASRMHRL